MSEPLLTERVYFRPPQQPSSADTWWSRYAAQLDELSPTAKASIEADSAALVATHNERIASKMDRVLRLFPILAERREQLAGQSLPDRIGNGFCAVG